MGEARRAEGCERKEREGGGGRGVATLVCNEGVAADHTRPKNTLSAKPTPYDTPRTPPASTLPAVMRVR